MPAHYRFHGLIATAALLAAAVWPAVLGAQDAPAPDAGATDRGVARISVVNGEVSVRRGDSGEWVAAAANAPLMAGDQLASGPGARAEVQFDSSNLIRIGANAEIRLAQLDSGHYTVQVAHGTVTFRELRESRAQVELETQAVSIKPSPLGSYRIYAQEDGQAEITVRLGQAEIFTPRGNQPLRAGQTMLVRGAPADPEFRIVPAIVRDQWDQWNEERDRQILRSNSYRHVPRDVYGAEDLDNNGRWVDVPTYGEVWSPAVGPDWAPYQNGRWAWEDYYGWTWVSFDPWGWAPFHYGRWFWDAPYGWCWYPGGLGATYWSPALVAFFGLGPGAGVGFGYGSIGWVPLAPYEPLYAWWGHSDLNRGINADSVNVGDLYRNARVPNAVASVNAGDFRQGRFGNIARVSGAQVRQAGLVRGPLPVAPTAASLRYSNRAVAFAPRSNGNVRFFSHNPARPSVRVPFSEQQRAMQQYSRQPVVAAHNNPPATGVAHPGAWRAVNIPNAPAAASAPAVHTSGWQRFGEPRPAAASRTGWPAPRPSYTQPAGQAFRPQSQSIRVAPPVVRERSAAPAHHSEPAGHAAHEAEHR